MDDPISISLLLGIAVTMVFSAFFSGMEIAFVTSNRMLAEMDKERNRLAQKAQTVFYKHPNNFVSTMLVGNNIALVVYGILIARLFDNTLFTGMDVSFTVPADTVLSTLIVLFTGEFLPKTFFKNNPNRLLSLCGSCLLVLRGAVAGEPLLHLPVPHSATLGGRAREERK